MGDPAMHEHSSSKGEVKPGKKKKKVSLSLPLSLSYLSQCLYSHIWYYYMLFLPISFSNDMNRCDLRDKTGNVASVWHLFNAPLSWYPKYHACIYMYMHIISLCLSTCISSVSFLFCPLNLNLVHGGCNQTCL